MERHRVALAPWYGRNQLGLFATSEIRAGDVVLSEKALLSLRSATTPAAVEKSHTDFLDTISSLSVADLGRLKNLGFRTGDPKQANEIKNFTRLARPAMETAEAFEMLVWKAFFAHSIPFAPGEEAEAHRLFGQVCFINHACRPNATLNWSESSGDMVLRGTREIDDGEEIVVSYLADPFKKQTDRHMELGFTCKCIVCVSSSDNPAIDEAYLDLHVSLHVLDIIRTKMLDPPFPEDWRKVDRAQIRAIAKAAGEHGIQSVAERVQIRAEQLGMKHEKLAEAFEMESAASLAWFLTHEKEGNMDRCMNTAVRAKAREMSMLCFCLGLHDPRADKVQRQLWWMVQPYAKPVEVFSKVAGEAGMAVDVDSDGADVLKFA